LYLLTAPLLFFFLFLFNHTPTTELYTLSLHDALPIFTRTSSPTFAASPGAEVPLSTATSTSPGMIAPGFGPCLDFSPLLKSSPEDRKSTRLNSSHDQISYAVFCLKKKKKKKKKRDLAR